MKPQTLKNSPLWQKEKKMVHKYHQTRKDRHDESRGMKDYYKGKGEEMSPRYGREHHGSMDSGYMGMLHEDHSAPANLPQHVVHKYYPECDYVDNYYLDDTYKGIDENIDDSVEKIEHHQSDSMY